MEDGADRPWSFFAYPTAAKLDERVSQKLNHTSSIVCEMLNSLDLAPAGAAESFAIPGITGHSGMASHALIAETRCATSRKYLFASSRSYEQSLNSTHVIRQSATQTVLPMKSLISTAFARCNQAPLWPFMPFGRGEDHMLARCLRSGGVNPFVISLPFSLAHAPVHGRTPNATVQVDSISSILSGVMDFIGPCATLGELANRLDRVFGNDGSLGILQVAIGEHAKRQADYCAEIGSAPDVCTLAFSSLEYMVLEWTSLYKSCASGHLTPSLKLQFSLAGENVRQLISLARDWDRLWHLWRENAQEIWQECALSRH
jgi:hypothetical protein